MQPAVALFLFWVILGFSPVIGAIGAPLANPVLLVLLSCAIGFLCFLPGLARRGQLGQVFERKNILSYLIIANFGTALPFCALLFALRYTTPANVAILNQAELVYALIFAHFLTKEKITLPKLGACALVVFGVLAILADGGFKVNLKGDLIVLACVWMFQLSHIASKKLPAQISDSAIAAAKNIYSLPLLLVLLLLTYKTTPGAFFGASPVMFGVLFYFGVIRYALSFGLWVYVIRRMYIYTATAVALSFPALALAISVAMGYDALSWYKIAGLISALAGAALLNFYLSGKEAA